MKTEQQVGCREDERMRGKDQSWKKKKVKAGRRVAEFRVYNDHVACDSMQGLTRSARGTDGPTQQYLCMHVCACVCIMPSYYLFIHLFSMEVNMENGSLDMITNHVNFSERSTHANIPAQSHLPSGVPQNIFTHANAHNRPRALTDQTTHTEASVCWL